LPWQNSLHEHTGSKNEAKFYIENDTLSMLIH
jgi:hypothetical protein